VRRACWRKRERNAARDFLDAYHHNAEAHHER
jgi:hypothetical protein